MHCAGMILCKDRADLGRPGARIGWYCETGKRNYRDNLGTAMRLVIEIAAAALLVFCISATGAAFAAGKAGRSADGLSCSLIVPANVPPAARCASIKRQCGGKFHANYCGDKLLSAM